MEAKFLMRVYHIPTRTMYKYACPTPTWYVVSAFNYDDGRDEVQLLMSECELMMCSGLSDKNGTLIYSGDVVRCGMLGHTTKRDTMIGVVDFYNGAFFVKFTDFFTDLSGVTLNVAPLVGFSIIGEVTIIGNIWEEKDNKNAKI